MHDLLNSSSQRRAALSPGRIIPPGLFFYADDSHAVKYFLSAAYFFACIVFKSGLSFLISQRRSPPGRRRGTGNRNGDTDMEIKIDSVVTCNSGDIDRVLPAGLVGKVTGFARFSSYHAREAMVRFDDGRSGWFWERDLAPATPA